MDKYKVKINPKAIRQLDSVYKYIANEKSAPENAKRQVDRIKRAILNLDIFPQSHQERNEGRYAVSSAIDEQTNIFTLGALIFEFLGSFSYEEIHQRYCGSQFMPCLLCNWQLNEESYRVAAKAVSLNKNDRYLTFGEFLKDWKEATSSIK